MISSGRAIRYLFLAGFATCFYPQLLPMRAFVRKPRIINFANLDRKIFDTLEYLFYVCTFVYHVLWYLQIAMNITRDLAIFLRYSHDEILAQRGEAGKAVSSRHYC